MNLISPLSMAVFSSHSLGVREPFLAMFGHQWEFGTDEALVVLERFFDELEGCWPGGDGGTVCS